MTNSPTNLENMRLAAAAIREWMPETLPANEAGQVHFARALAESAAEAIEQFISSSPTNLENAERAEMTMTPHAYAQEYEFRGDTDYTPSDFERTMIEDAILGYLGEARIAERAEMEPKVKPLEWRVEGENRNGPWLWEASSIVKGYTIRHMPNELYKLDGHGEWATLKAAKAAAQSDYEARIRSCLLDKPEAGEVDAGVVERLTRFVRGRPKVYEGQPFNCDKRLKADVRHVLVEIDRLRRELEEARRALEQVCKDAKRVDVYQNGAPLDLVQPYLIDAARAALRAGEEGK